jgi:hypothetical protein
MWFLGSIKIAKLHENCRLGFGVCTWGITKKCNSPHVPLAPTWAVLNFHHLKVLESMKKSSKIVLTTFSFDNTMRHADCWLVVIKDNKSKINIISILDTFFMYLAFQCYCKIKKSSMDGYMENKIHIFSDIPMLRILHWLVDALELHEEWLVIIADLVRFQPAYWAIGMYSNNEVYQNRNSESNLKTEVKLYMLVRLGTAGVRFSDNSCRGRCKLPFFTLRILGQVKTYVFLEINILEHWIKYRRNKIVK